MREESNANCFCSYRTLQQRITQREVHHATFLARCRALTAAEGAEEFRTYSEIALKDQLTAVTRSFRAAKAKHMEVADASVEDDDREAAAVWLLPVEDIFIATSTKIKERIDELSIERRANEPSTTPVQQPAIPNSVFRLETVRAPEVGEFDGSPVAWPAFRDLFKAEIHERDLNDVTKLLYLQRACTGRAKAALGTWKPVANNYSAAWDTLERKYNDNYRIKQALIDELFKLPRCVDETFDNLRKIIDTTTSVLRQLDTMGEQTEYWDAIVINVLVTRIPINTIDAWEQRRNTDQQPTLDKLLEFLEGKARGKINSAASARDRERRPRGSEYANGNARNSNETKGNNWSKPAEPRSPSTRPPCKQCGEDHALFRCPTLLSKSIEQRGKFISDNKLCENCLRSHPGDCFYSGCPRCNYDKHNSILCKKQPPGPAIRSAVHTVVNKRNNQSRSDRKE